MEQGEAPNRASFFRMSVQEKIQQLLWDKRYVFVPEEVRALDLDYVLIKDMTVEDRNLYSFVRMRELDSARKQGVPTEAEIMVQAKAAGFWTAEDDLILSKADEHIAFLKGELSRQKFLARKKSLQADIDNTIEKKNTVQSKKGGYFVLSAEYLASEIAASTLIRRLVLRIDGSQLWKDDSSFLLFKQNHLGFVVFITNEVLSEGLMPIDEIREVARDPEWRLTWTLQRENLPGIFGRKISDLTLSQKLLIYWSRVYDSAFEGSEPPSSEVINDDDKFDEWLANRDLAREEQSDKKRLGAKDHQERMQLLDGEYSEVCNCGAKAKNVGKGLGERVQHTRTCPWGTFRKYTSQEKEQIARQTYSRNTDRVRTMLEKEQQVIVEKGQIEEHHLRDKKTRHVYGMKTDIVSKQQ